MSKGCWDFIVFSICPQLTTHSTKNKVREKPRGSLEEPRRAWKSLGETGDLGEPGRAWSTYGVSISQLRISLLLKGRDLGKTIQTVILQAWGYIS